MDVVTAVFAAIALVTMASRFATRRMRHSSVLAAAGLDKGGKSSSRQGFRLFSTCEAAFARLGRTIAPRVGDDTLQLLEESGSQWTPTCLQGLRAVAGALLASASLPLGLAALPLAPVLFAAGYHVPIMALKRKRRRCWGMIASDMPEIVDLMAVLCFSGESLLLAFRHAVSASGNPCSAERWSAYSNG